MTAADGSESDWQIVGINYDPLANSAAYVPLFSLQKELGEVGRTNALFLQAGNLSSTAQANLVQRVSEQFESRGFDVSPNSTYRYSTIDEIVQETTGSYSLIIQLLAIMAIIIAVVGGVGLSGVLTLNVLERRREIGVMRSIGASSWRVIRLYIGEGILLGVLSWMIALPLSIPAAYGMATQGLSFALNAQLAYRFSPQGALIWLVIIIILAVFASTLPARSASRISVRESLTY